MCHGKFIRNPLSSSPSINVGLSMFIECQCPEVAYQCNHNLLVSQCFYLIHLMLWTPRAATAAAQAWKKGEGAPGPVQRSHGGSRSCRERWTGRCWRFGVKGPSGGSIVKGQNGWFIMVYISLYKFITEKSHENPWPLGRLTIVEPSSHRDWYLLISSPLFGC